MTRLFPKVSNISLRDSEVQSKLSIDIIILFYIVDNPLDASPELFFNLPSVPRRYLNESGERQLEKITARKWSRTWTWVVWL